MFPSIESTKDTLYIYFCSETTEKPRSLSSQLIAYTEYIFIPVFQHSVTAESERFLVCCLSTHI